jgi:hypothetical protein
MVDVELCYNSVEKGTTFIKWMNGIINDNANSFNSETVLSSRGCGHCAHILNLYRLRRRAACLNRMPPAFIIGTLDVPSRKVIANHKKSSKRHQKKGECDWHVPENASSIKNAKFI